MVKDQSLPVIEIHQPVSDLLHNIKWKQVRNHTQVAWMVVKRTSIWEKKKILFSGQGRKIVMGLW
jgi:hypothetical protein